MRNLKNLKVYKKMLIVVDMVNGFVNEGPLHDEAIADVIPRQLEVIRKYQKEGQLIVFIKDTHTKDSVELKRFNNEAHCSKGTKEARLIDELQIFENADNVISIEKNSTSYMEAPDFRKLVSELLNVSEVEVVGCCTDICVFNGTMGLANYFDQWNRNVNIRVHLDAIATFCENERKNYVEAANLLMKQQGIQLVKKK